MELRVGNNDNQNDKAPGPDRELPNSYITPILVTNLTQGDGMSKQTSDSEILGPLAKDPKPEYLTHR
ncbi:MAG: hypothetical protein ACFCD0_21460 [Gemmataceae bacterium]